MDKVSFTDSSGVVWQVSEEGADDPLPLRRSEHTPGAGWLHFESEYEVRRLWHYPDDWRGLNPLQLEALLDRASTVVARFRQMRRDLRSGATGGYAEEPRLNAPPPGASRERPPASARLRPPEDDDTPHR